MLWPFLSSIIFAGILAGSFTPLMRVIDSRLHLPKWSAIIVCLVIILAIFLPSIFIVIKLSEEALILYQSISKLLLESDWEKMILGFQSFPEVVRKAIEMADLQLNANSIKGVLLDTSKEISTGVINVLNSWIANIFSFFLRFIIMIIVIYTLLVDGTKIKAFMFSFLPLPEDEVTLVIDRFNQINYVTLIGNGMGAIIQGLLAGIGFWMAGVESITLWTTVMIVMAFIPLVGISIVYVPACLFFLITGETFIAIVLFSYCTLVSLVVENWFKPKFVGTHTKIHSTVIFLSIIGGMTAFGVPGIFYGPLIISIFLTFVDLYHKRYTHIRS